MPHAIEPRRQQRHLVCQLRPLHGRQHRVDPRQGEHAGDGSLQRRRTPARRCDDQAVARAVAALDDAGRDAELLPAIQQDRRRWPGVLLEYRDQWAVAPGQRPRGEPRHVRRHVGGQAEGMAQRVNNRSCSNDALFSHEQVATIASSPRKSNVLGCRLQHHRSDVPTVEAPAGQEIATNKTLCSLIGSLQASIIRCMALQQAERLPPLHVRRHAGCLTDCKTSSVTTPLATQAEQITALPGI